MRRFFIFVTFIVCFIIAGFCKYDSVNFAFNQSANPKYYFYVTLNSQTDDEHFIKNGNGGIICLEESELDLLNDFDINTIYGQSIKFYGNDSDFYRFIKDYNININYEESFNNLKIIYGYNSNFGKSVILNEKEVNVQLVKKENEINVGFPLILGSY